jgi:hypothetical protein
MTITLDPTVKIEALTRENLPMASDVAAQIGGKKLVMSVVVTHKARDFISY